MNQNLNNTDATFTIRPGHSSNSPSNTAQGKTKVQAISTAHPQSRDYLLSPEFWATIDRKEPPPPFMYELYDVPSRTKQTEDLRTSAPCCATLPIKTTKNLCTAPSTMTSSSQYVDMPSFDLATEAATGALHHHRTNNLNTCSNKNLMRKEPVATTRLLPEESAKEPRGPPLDIDQAVNLSVRSPCKLQLVELIIPQLEPTSNILALQQLLHHEPFQCQLNQCIDSKLNNMLDKLTELITSFNASSIFDDQQKQALREFESNEIQSLWLPEKVSLSCVALHSGTHWGTVILLGAQV